MDISFGAKTHTGNSGSACSFPKPVAINHDRPAPRRLRRFGIWTVSFSLLLLPVEAAFAQGIYSHWINKTGGTVPATSLGAAMDTSTNVYVLGRFYDYTNRIGSTTLTNLIGVSNLFFAKFTGNAVTPPAWAKTVVTEYPVSQARIVSDSSGDCIVADSFGGTNLSLGGSTLTNFGTAGGHSEDVFVAQFNTAGTFQRLMQLGGTSEDTLGGLTIDHGFGSASGFYLTGAFQSTNFSAGSTNLTRLSSSGSDCFAAKFNLSGSLLWIQQGAYAVGSCIEVDTSNNCYVGGTTLGPATFNGLSPANPTTTNFLAKYNKNGNLLWVRGDVPVGSRLAADKLQNIYLTGTFSDVLQFGPITLSNNSPSTIFVAKCDTNGTPLWARQLPGWGYDDVSAITVDSVGNCWVAGYFASSPQATLPTNSIAIIVCFDNAGNLLAVSQTKGDGPSAADAVCGTGNNFNGNICVSGTFITNFVMYGKYVVTNLSGADIFASVGGVSPQLKISTSGTNLILNWPVVTSTFTLQVVTDLSGASWSTVGNGVNVNGQMTVTNNPIGSSVRFYRLINNNP